MQASSYHRGLGMAFHTHKLKQYTPYDTVEACCGGGGDRFQFTPETRHSGTSETRQSFASRGLVHGGIHDTQRRFKIIRRAGLEMLVCSCFCSLRRWHHWGVVRAIHAILRRLGFLLVGLFASVVQIGSLAFAPQLRALLGGRRTMRC